MKTRTVKTIFRVRKQVEDLRAMALAGAVRKRGVALAQRAEIVAAQRHAIERAQSLLQQVFDPAEVRLYYQYERYLSRLADAKDAQIHAMDEDVEAHRKVLEEAMLGRRIAEKLEERHLAAEATARGTAERKLIDEGAAIRAVLRPASAQEWKR